MESAIQRVHCTEGPLYRGSIVQRVHCTEDCTEGPLYRGSTDGVLCWYVSFMFRVLQIRFNGGGEVPETSGLQQTSALCRCD